MADAIQHKPVKQMAGNGPLAAGVAVNGARAESAPPAAPGVKNPHLELMEIIERSPEVTQRGIANEMRIALGLANSYLKRLARKGWIKIKQAPGRRWLYYLTPKGMSEKTRLTYEYVRFSALFYGDARQRCRRLFERLVLERGARRVAFLGWSDLAEIAYLILQEFPTEFVAIFDTEPSRNVGNGFFGMAIQPLGKIEEDHYRFDVLVYTRMEPPSHDPLLDGLEFEEIV